MPTRSSTLPESYRSTPDAELLSQFFKPDQVATLQANPTGLRGLFGRPATSRGGRQLLAATELIRRATLAELQGEMLTTPEMTQAYLVRHFFGRTFEVFAVMYLDNRHRLIAVADVFRGTIDGASVHPREIVRDAIAHNAAAVILAHNHPSGVAEPSQADELITRRLKEALLLVEIRILDHIVVAGGLCVSMAQTGRL